MIKTLASIASLALCCWLSAGCATSAHEQPQGAAASPAVDASVALVDDSSITPLMDASYNLADLAVKNTSDHAVVATLEWDGGLDVSRQFTVIVYPHSTTDTHVPLAVKPDATLQMKIVDAQWQ